MALGAPVSMVDTASTAPEVVGTCGKVCAGPLSCLDKLPRSRSQVEASEGSVGSVGSVGKLV